MSYPLTVDQRIGRNLAHHRIRRGFTQIALAAFLCVHRTTVIRIEDGTRPLRFREAIHIRDAFGLSLTRLAAPIGRRPETPRRLPAAPPPTSRQKTCYVPSEVLVKVRKGRGESPERSW